MALPLAAITTLLDRQTDRQMDGRQYVTGFHGKRVATTVDADGRKVT